MRQRRRDGQRSRGVVARCSVGEPAVGWLLALSLGGCNAVLGLDQPKLQADGSDEHNGAPTSSASNRDTGPTGDGRNAIDGSIESGGDVTIDVEDAGETGGSGAFDDHGDAAAVGEGAAAAGGGADGGVIVGEAGGDDVIVGEAGADGGVIAAEAGDASDDGRADAGARPRSPCVRGQAITLAHDINYQMRGLTTGKDGAMWAVETDAKGRANARIVRITPYGEFKEYPVPTANGFAHDLVLGPDDNLWFTEKVAMKLGRITPAGVITEFPLSKDHSWPRWITVGPDGNIWFARSADEDEALEDGTLLPDNPDFGDSLGYINPVTAEIKEFWVTTGGKVDSRNITNLATGPDGQLWFTERQYLKKMTVDGVFTQYRVVLPFLDNNNFIGLALGADGNMWFTGGWGDNKVGPVTRDGVFLNYIELPPWEDNKVTRSTLPMGIIQSSDGNMYFIEYLSSRIGRVNFPYPSNPKFTEFQMPAQLRPAEIVEGPDHNIWVSIYGGIVCLGLH